VQLLIFGAAYLPAGQPVQTPEPAVEKVPAPQARQLFVVAPVAVMEVPDSQTVQASLPAAGWYEPAAHLLQALAPFGAN